MDGPRTRNSLCQRAFVNISQRGSSKEGANYEPNGNLTSENTSKSLSHWLMRSNGCNGANCQTVGMRSCRCFPLIPKAWHHVTLRTRYKMQSQRESLGS